MTSRVIFTPITNSGFLRHLSLKRTAGFIPHEPAVADLTHSHPPHFGLVRPPAMPVSGKAGEQTLHDCRLRTLQSVFFRVDHRVHAVAQLQLCEHTPHVCFHGGFRQKQLAADF